MEESRAKSEVIAAGRELVSRGLVARTWGNVSCRIDAHRFAITPSGIGYDRLGENEIVVVDARTLEYEGTVKPSSEKGIHAAAYRLSPETNFVIHTHQTYATCMSVAGHASLAPTAEETALLGGEIALAEYGLPGTKKLMRNVAAVLASGCAAVLMQKHGALLTGGNRGSAFERAVALEDVCRRAAGSLPPLANAAPDITGSRQGGGAPAIQCAGGSAFADTSEAVLRALHGAIYKAYPQFNCIAHQRVPAVEEVMAGADALPALIDDFAQMVGGDVRRAAACAGADGRVDESAVANAVKKLKGRGGVYVEGLGLLCCASEQSDCEALGTLVEKNALAYLNARRHGADARLPWLDKKIMRLVYTKKYTKKK